MLKKWQYLAIGGGALVVIIIFILLVTSGPGLDISGRYELLITGRLTDTVIEITPSGNDFKVTLSKGESVRSEYIVPRPRGNGFVIEKTVDGRIGDRFDLTVTDEGFKGTADISTLATGIEVLFRKVK